MSQAEFFERYRRLGAEPRETKIDKSVRFAVDDHQALLTRLEKKGVRLEKIPFLRDGYRVVDSTVSVGATLEYLRGMYYVQESASQLPVQALFSTPSTAEELVLDCCAAPGGKTTQIAQYHPGRVLALEKMQKRIGSLRNNCERMHTSQVSIYKKDAKYVSELGLLFDRILVDAPCSGNFVTDKRWFERREVTGFLENQRKQQEILSAAAKCLKPGGTLVYSTCSLEPEEDEIVVDWLLSLFSDLALVEIDTPGDPGLTTVFGKKLDDSLVKCKRLWPWKTGTQGFFIAKLVKEKKETD